jgi:TonB family protein
MDTWRSRAVTAVLAALVFGSAAPAAENASGLVSRGNQLLIQGEFQRAAALFERARRIAGDGCAECHLGLAQANFGLERFSRALSSALLAIERGERGDDRRDPRLLAAAAEVLEASLWNERQNRGGVLRRAAGAFRKVLRAGGPGERTATTGLLHVLGRLGRAGEIVDLARTRLDTPDKRRLLAAAEASPMGTRPAPQTPVSVLMAVNDGLRGIGWEGPYFFVGVDFEWPVRTGGQFPAYTEEARRARVTGTVILRGIITADGRITALEALKGLSHGLTESSLDAVRTWTFEPARLGGVPVAVFYTLRISYQIQ